MNEHLKAVIEQIKTPVYYDAETQRVIDGEGKFLLDVRGWGWMQKFENGSGMQDAFGEEICRLINSGLIV